VYLGLFDTVDFLSNKASLQGGVFSIVNTLPTSIPSTLTI